MMRIYAINFPEIDEIVADLDLKVIHIQNTSIDEIKKLINKETIIFNKINSIAIGGTENIEEIFEYIKSLQIGKTSLTYFEDNDKKTKAIQFIKTTINSVIELVESNRTYIDTNTIHTEQPLSNDIFVDVGAKIVKLYCKGDSLDVNDFKRRVRKKGITDKCFFIDGKKYSISITLISKPNTIFSTKRDKIHN